MERQKEQNQMMLEMQTRMADQEIRIQELTTGSKGPVKPSSNAGKIESVEIKVEQIVVDCDEEEAEEGPCTRTRAKRRRDGQPVMSQRVKKNRK